MKKIFSNLKSSFSAVLHSGAQISVLVAVVASQFGERVLRGSRGFATYRDTVTEQG